LYNISLAFRFGSRCALTLSRPRLPHHYKHPESFCRSRAGEKDLPGFQWETFLQGKEPVFVKISGADIFLGASDEFRKKNYNPAH
jgi:hypothetical protein